ncbi:MAG: hypothetical protein AB8F74_19345 [Saprospiraceae bacterium]
MGLGDLLNQANQAEKKAEDKKQEESGGKAAAQSNSQSTGTGTLAKSQEQKPTRKRNAKKANSTNQNKKMASEISFSDALVKNSSEDRDIGRIYVFKEQKEAIEKIAKMFNVKQNDLASNMIDIFLEVTREERQTLFKKRIQEIGDL